MHHHLHQKVSDPVGHELDAPGDNPVDACQDEDTVPHPENGKDLQQSLVMRETERAGLSTDLVIDHVEGENTDGSFGLLASSPAIPLVVTHSHYDKHHHYYHQTSVQLELVLPLGKTSHMGLCEPSSNLSSGGNLNIYLIITPAFTNQESPVMLIYQEPIGKKLVVKKCICYKELKKDRF